MESRQRQRLADLQRRLALLNLQTRGSSQPLPQPQIKKSSGRHQLKTMVKGQTRIDANDTLMPSIEQSIAPLALHENGTGRNRRIPPLQSHELSYNRPTPSTSTSKCHQQEHGTKQQVAYHYTNQPRKMALYLNQYFQYSTKDGTNKNAQPVALQSKSVLKSHNSMNEDKHSSTLKSQPNKDEMYKHTKSNQKTETVAEVLCVECDMKITGQVRAKFSSTEGVGFKCSKCNDSAVYCYDCTLDWGSFCAGEICNNFYCGSCRPDYLGEEGEDQYCGRTCMGKYHPDFKKYSRHRVPFSDKEQEEDKIAAMLGYRQCKGITKKGFILMCKDKSMVATIIKNLQFDILHL